VYSHIGATKTPFYKTNTQMHHFKIRPLQKPSAPSFVYLRIHVLGQRNRSLIRQLKKRSSSPRAACVQIHHSSLYYQLCMVTQTWVFRWICYLTTLQVRSRLPKDSTETCIYSYVRIQNVWTKLKLLQGLLRCRITRAPPWCFLPMIHSCLTSRLCPQINNPSKVKLPLSI
jgi:hypothetical protein